ncbi:hypothetical protein DPMN_192573 [Dreissena polymorpha]|uniref:Uncharacterized protein n=1 Tax=Dreissena polymorpha TaxID=45954 RepID=A0A9D3Y6J6_DREPO|nr:hypothetical protein DPMN_192573 [Dreissena polymorpha]
MRYSSKASTVAISGHYESDSDTSGCLSTSSLDSTGEDIRLTVNDDKMMSVWNCWSDDTHYSSSPKCSTPKRTSPSGVLKKRVNFKTGRRRFEQKSRSEGDLRGFDVNKPLDCNNAESLDSALKTFSCIQNRAYAGKDWKPRPYMTQSTSENDVRIAGNKSKYDRFPRYRVTMNDRTRAIHSAMSGCSVDESMSEFLS